jgi:hypothetical protein
MSKQSDEILLTVPRGLHRLAAVHHRANGPAVVVIAHGFTGTKTEAGRLFVEMARALTLAGISALRFDFMGSGDSSGAFAQMTPKTEIADLNAVLDWAGLRYRHVGVLGLSFGGAVSICTVERRQEEISALCTWSSVPSFKFWRPEPDGNDLDPENPERVGPKFFSARPRRDVPEAYRRLRLPKLQIQGDADLPGFREIFEETFATAPEPKRHLILPGADHVFTRVSDRRQVIGETVGFFGKWMKTKTSP